MCWPLDMHCLIIPPKAICKMGTICVCLMDRETGVTASRRWQRCGAVCVLAVLSEQNKCREGKLQVTERGGDKGPVLGLQEWAHISTIRCAFSKDWGSQTVHFFSQLHRGLWDSLYFKARAGLWEEKKSEDWNLRVLFGGCRKG